MVSFVHVLPYWHKVHWSINVYVTFCFVSIFTFSFLILGERQVLTFFWSWKACAKLLPHLIRSPHRRTHIKLSDWPFALKATHPGGRSEEHTFKGLDESSKHKSDLPPKWKAIPSTSTVLRKLAIRSLQVPRLDIFIALCVPAKPSYFIPDLFNYS